ncbi:ribonucleotide reductase subunit alpha [Adlercreutzia sp. ZJ138]|uniref:ribonucleotide reductase subunit alpha n=1 Tax=Adlercreutzia sp. ZJ138 TaxID=2709405 RepID=UPI0013EAE380|nr:ribonucleotide reductase subunit alpha [Adlercreutzia sp. ZJ138]
MFENDGSASPSQNDEYRQSPQDYLMQAECACASGDEVLGMHLYLAAFERLSHEGGSPAATEAALASLKSAWDLACKLRERTIAEYVFERLGHFLKPDEVDACALQLQDLAFDKLQEFGLTREDLQGVTDLIAQEARAAVGDVLAQDVDLRMDETDTLRAAVQESESDTTVVPSAVSPMVPAASSTPDAQRVPKPVIKSITPLTINVPKAATSTGGHAQSAATVERVRYSDLVGFDRAIAAMRSHGVGMQKDPQFQQLVELLNKRHGVEGMPVCDALLFSSPAREDAARFMEATFGELELPGVRMRMEEGISGMPVLCVMSQSDNQPKLNAAKNGFDGEGVLLLEDIDLWVSPFVDQQPAEDLGGLLIASLSRGAREAMNLIRSAVEHPGVHVLASMSSIGEVDPFFLDMLEPLTVIDIELPNAKERADIWMEIAREHPSMRGIDRAALVRHSANLPRFDLYMAAKEAVDEAYRDSLAVRGYVPVTASNLFEKIAAYQPLESPEYRRLEDEVVGSLRNDFDELERYMNGEIS